MEPYTLDRTFHKQKVIDSFHSVIWTERYYGDSVVEIVVPASAEMVDNLPEGTLLGMDQSKEIMILETANIEDGKLKLTGISLLPWLNNRFIRTSNVHEDRYWYLSGNPAGFVLWAIVYNMCCVGSPYLDGTIDTGVVDPEDLAIPGLVLGAYDSSGPNVAVGIPFGPVYVAMKDLAVTYQIGMKITLEAVTDSDYTLEFQSYKGLDRSSAQTVRPVVRFSPDMDSLTDIKELKSIAALKTLAYAFAPGNPDGLATDPGVSTLGGTYTGFDLRALLVFSEDITTDQVGGSSANLVEILNNRASVALNTNKAVQAVDGEIVPENQFRYGVHYRLGDLVEMQGYTGIITTGRVTEYIRSQDATGQKAYPTIEAVG